MSEFRIERQVWSRWPKVVKVIRTTDNGREERRYVRKGADWEAKEYATAKIAELRAENAKLRELVRDLYECVSHANEQDWFYFERNMLGCGMCCTVNGESCGLSVLTARMLELGVDA